MTTDINEEEKLKRLHDLVKRNVDLDRQLQELLAQYSDMSARDDQYAQLLREFGLDDAGKKERQGVRHFKMASVIYVVIKGHKKLSQVGDPQLQLDLLDEITLGIADCAERHNLVKISSVGDNMLLCGGVVQENKTNPIDAVCAAVEISQWMEEFRKGHDIIWELQCGVHTGPVIARYTGKSKKPYTLSGANVLTATRLALTADIGAIAVSPMTSGLVRDFFEVEPFFKMPVKYSGEMQVFKLLNLRPELASGNPERPYNDTFDLYYSRVQFMDIQEYVLDMLERNLPHNLYYHNVKHTIDVTTEVELIGWAEGLPESDILLLKVAALFHDSGQIKVNKGHEEVSCQYVDEILPRYNYSPDKIATIKRIIMATKVPHTPADILEAVIEDSDLDYLGRSDFVPVSNMLYKELIERDGAKLTINEWNKLQIKFISNHQYFTKTAQSLREVNKQVQIERLKDLVEECERSGGGSPACDLR